MSIPVSKCQLVPVINHHKCQYMPVKSLSVCQSASLSFNSVISASFLFVFFLVVLHSPSSALSFSLKAFKRALSDWSLQSYYKKPVRIKQQTFFFKYFTDTSLYFFSFLPKQQTFFNLLSPVCKYGELKNEAIYDAHDFTKAIHEIKETYFS